jgi:LacI family transcriptional regulator
MKAPVQSLIAESLRLSQGTVSRALRNRPGIRPEVRSRVLAAANQLGYQLPTVVVEGPATEEGLFAGVLLHAPHDRWRGRDGYLMGLSMAAPALNVTLVLHHVNTVDCEGILAPANQPPVMRRGAMKALVLVFRWPHEVVRQLSETFTCVSLQHEYPGLPVDVVSVNYTQAMSELMRHLHGLGHRKIGFVGRSGDLSWSRGRFAGYVDSLCQLGLEYHPERVVDVATLDLEAYERPGNPWEGYVEKVMRQMEKGVKAWMFASDWSAYAVCRGLMQRGVRIPQDVSVTGFDALGDAMFGCPLLTAAAVPQQTMGEAALRLVMQRLGRAELQASHTVFNCAVRVGESTGPLAHVSGAKFE